MPPIVITEAMITEAMKLGQAICALTGQILSEQSPEVKALNQRVAAEMLKGPLLILEAWNRFLGQITHGQITQG